MSNQALSYKQPAFTEFNNYFINLFNTYFENDLKNYGISHKYKINGVYNYLQQEISIISTRTLIREMHILKDSGKLIGETSKQRFAYFEEMLKTEEFRKYLFNKYEMLQPLINRKIKQTSEYVAQIISNFLKDKNELEAVFNKKFETIKDITLGSGDTHNGGKTVAIITGSFGKIVYKPHHLYGDILFTSVVNLINEKALINYKLSTLKILNKENYGFQEFIEFKECEDEEGAARYYYRCGASLAIFYILGTNDMHYENVIVNEETPYFIDLETLVTSNNKIQNVNVLKNSVFNTGYIPFNLGIIDIDMSGLCSKSKESKKMKGNYFENYKTDEMCVKTKFATLPQSTNNILINGKRPNIEDFTKDIILGFYHVLNFIKNNKNQYKKVIEVNLNNKASLRQLCRHTYVYAKFLDASLHPDYLIKKDNFEGLFQILIKKCEEESELKRVKDEVKTLINGDVPLYYSKFDLKHLYSSTIIFEENNPLKWHFNEEIVTRDYFTKTTKEVLFSKIDNLTDKEIDLQINFIKMSLFLAYEKPFENYNKALKPIKQNKSKEEIINAFVLNIIKNLFEEGEDKQKYMYVNKLNQNEETTISFLDYSLYEGGGLIWFLACAAQEFKNENYKSMALQLLKVSRSVYELEKEKGDLKLSAFSGIGSSLYLYYNMSKLLNNNELYNTYKEDLNYLNSINFTKLEDDKDINNFDFLGGISGLITLLCRIYLETKNLEDKETIKNILNKLDKYFYNFFYNYNLEVIGLAHGLCGIALTCTLLYKVKEDNKYINMALKLLQQENNLFKFENKINETKWCRGASGMALARNEMINLLQDTDIDTKIIKHNLNIYIEETYVQGIHNMNNSNLCHGIYGNIDILNTITKNKNYKNIISRDKINEISNMFIGENGEVHLGLKANFQLQTFMLGTAGVYYTILRLQNRKLPSVLSLEVIKEEII